MPSLKLLNFAPRLVAGSVILFLVSIFLFRFNPANWAANPGLAFWMVGLSLWGFLWGLGLSVFGQAQIAAGLDRPEAHPQSDLERGNQDRVFWLTWGLFTVLGGLFVVYHTALERYVYYWDSAGYWSGSIYGLSEFIKNPFKALQDMYVTILKDDYNELPCIMLAPALKLTGIQYVGYTLAVYMAFFVPAAALLSWQLREIGQDFAAGSQRMGRILAACLPVLLPLALAPICTGMIDVVGLAFCLLINACLIRNNFDKMPLWSVIMLGILICVLAMTRRWYGIWVVGAFAGVAITATLRWASDPDYNFSRLFRLGMYSLLACVVATVIWFFGFNQFLMRALFNDYSNVYASSQIGDPVYQLRWVISHVSILVVGLSLLGTVVAIWKESTRWFAVINVVELVVCYILVHRYNNFSYNHYILLFAPLAMLTFIGVVWLGQLKGGKYWMGAAIILLGFNFIQMLAPNAPAWPSPIASVIAETRIPPRVRNDLPALREMVSYLKQVACNEGHKVYVVASSFLLNDDILRNLEMPETHEALPCLQSGHAHVDHRDLFPVSFLTADIICLGKPTQYHLTPEGQRIVGWLAEGLVDSASFGRHYKLLRTFYLDDGIQVEILQKTSSWTKQEAEALAARFAREFPEYPAMAQVPSREAGTFDVQQPPLYGMAQWREDGKVLALHPGNSQAAGLRYSCGGQVDTVSFRPRFTNPCATGAEVVLEILADGRVTYSQYLEATKPVGLVKLPVKDVQVLQILISKGYKEDFCDELHLEEFTVK